MEYSYYILFHTHTEGMALYHIMRERGAEVKISPAPRAASVSCGMSLLVEPEEIDKVRSIIKETAAEYDRIVELPKQINPRRDVYC